MCDDASTRVVFQDHMDIPIVFANANEDGLSPASREALKIAVVHVAGYIAIERCRIVSPCFSSTNFFLACFT